MRIWLRAWLFAATLGACLVACDPTKPLVLTNHPPVVMSPLQAFPTTIGPGDSAIVTCIATDPDGDTVVYDWASDSRLIMHGETPGNNHELYDTVGGRLVVYPGYEYQPVDTAWISCYVRDGRGSGINAGHVHIVVQH